MRSPAAWLAGLVRKAAEPTEGGIAVLQRYLASLSTSRSGVPITLHTAMQVSAAFACARVLSEGIAQVPLKLFRTQDGRRDVARDHRLHGVLHTRPNPWQTSFEWRETAMLHAVFTGRHFSFINRVRGQVVELIPFEPHQVTTRRADDGTLSYEARLKTGTRVFPAETIFHLKGPSWTGWEGMDWIAIAREALGLAVATERHHADRARNGLNVPGTYSVDGTLTEKQYNDLRKFISDNYTGDKAGLPMVLDRGAKWVQQGTMTMVDAQHIETRRFQVEEVSRFMRVLPVMVGADQKTAAYASVEQQHIAHVVHTLGPWFSRLEQAFDAQLLTEEERDQGYYTHFVVAGLLRGALRDSAEYFSRALGAGGAPPWMTQDEVRELQELNPMGGTAARLPVATNVQTPAPAPQPAPIEA